MRLVIVGLGTQGRKREPIAGEDVVATVDPFHAEARYRDIEEVPLSCFDAALVCTPDDAKLGIVEYLLANRKHVLVEKPLLAPDSSSLTHLQELAAATQTVCYTAYNHRFEPNLARLKDVLDSGELGEIYLARLFYGNGTARNVRCSSWRDQGMGVLSDLGSHLLDLCLFFFGRNFREFKAWSANQFENKAFDHVLFGAPGRPALELEATLLSWRNRFQVDVFGERGSAHVDGLCKWGPSTFTRRRRVLPSGKPDEERHTLECADPTWAIEYHHFEALCRAGVASLENDIWINEVLRQVARRPGGNTG